MAGPTGDYGAHVRKRRYRSARRSRLVRALIAAEEMGPAEIQ